MRPGTAAVHRRGAAPARVRAFPPHPATPGMNIALIPTLIDQFQETFEGEVAPGVCWITSGPAESAILGTLDALTPDQALTPPAPGVLPAAAHAAHLRFALDLTLERLNGGNPPADWPSSFRLPPAAPGQSPAERWSALRQDLRRAYAAVLSFLQQRRHTPVGEWPPIHLAGLSAMTAHNAYHLGAIAVTIPSDEGVNDGDGLSRRRRRQQQQSSDDQPPARAERQWVDQPKCPR